MDTTIIEVVLGLVLIYITLALLVMKVQETLIGRWGHGRAKNLHDLVREAVGHDENLKRRIFENPLVFALSRGDEVPNERTGKLGPAVGPSVLPPDLFARALLIELNPGGKGAHPSERFASPTAFVAEAAGEHDVAERIWGTLRGLLAGREADWPGFEAAIANWFRDIGDRSEGWYKRKSQAWSLRLAIAAALLLNVDSFYVAQRLSTEPELRQGLASLAERVNALFPQGTFTGIGQAQSEASRAITPERPEARVTARLGEAVRHIHEVFQNEDEIAGYRLNRRAVNLESDAIKDASTDTGIEAFCKGPTAQGKPNEPDSKKKYLSDMSTWLIVLPQVMAFIEKQQVLDPSKSTNRENNLRSAYHCLSDISAWVQLYVSVSSKAAVRSRITDVSASLEGAKSALLEMIESQRPNYSLRQLFHADPEGFKDCATLPGASLRSIEACTNHSLAKEVRLPIGPFAANVRRQFCEVIPIPKFESAEAKSKSAPAAAGSDFLCGSDPFLGNPNLGLDGLRLQRKSLLAFVLWVLGCVVTGFFVALGAPFWFDVLGKVVNLRAAGRASEIDRRARGTPVAPLDGGAAPSLTPGADRAPFSLARNGFEDQLVPADIVAVQRQLDVAATGVLDAPTRNAIAAFTRSQGLEASDQLTFVVYERITRRSPAGATITRPSSRPARGEVNENVQPLARNLMVQLGFPGRIPAAETRFTDDLRALAVLYRYKLEAPMAPHARNTVTLARSNRAALDELDPKLASEILSYVGVPNPDLARNSAAPWLDWAIGELGQVEVGKANRAESNPRILQYLDTQGGALATGDETAWCGGFAAWVLAQHNAHPLAGAVGVSSPPPNALEAKHWGGASWGNPVGAGPGVAGGAQPGDVVTFRLGGVPNINHVAFVLELDPAGKTIWAIGGNQAAGTCVCVSRFSVAEIADIRRP